MKTDLSKILTIKGHGGLYRYIAQSRSGAIVESLADGARTNCPATAGITSLNDISIYTVEEEMKLRDVFLRMKEVLGEEDAPSSKAPADRIRELFQKAVPNYDQDRFYISHMKKVVDWYNALKTHASLDFEDPEAAEEAPAEEA